MNCRVPAAQKSCKCSHCLSVLGGRGDGEVDEVVGQVVGSQVLIERSCCTPNPTIEYTQVSYPLHSPLLRMGEHKWTQQPRVLSCTAEQIMDRSYIKVPG